MSAPKTPLDIIADQMDWDKPSPCKDCPFLKTTPFHAGVARSLPSYFASIGNNNFAHSCHKTDNRPNCDGANGMHVGRMKHCVGAILMLLKTGKGMDLQLPLLKAAEAGKVDLEARMRQAKKWKNVYTVGELIAFYEQELAKRAGRKVSVIA